MKNIFLLLALFFAELGFCQTANPYESIETVEADGTTFVVRRTKYTFMVSNAADSYVFQTNLCYKDGRELETEEEYDSVYASRSMSGQNRALQEALGDETITALRAYRGSILELFYAIDPDGKTLEVAFIMDATPELLALPMTAFAALERKLKEYVTWNPDDFTKQLKFFHASCPVFFEDVPLESEIKVIRNPIPDFSLNPDDLMP